MPVRPAKSSLYPLPPDYADLTTAGKRLARINAMQLQETPADLVHAWAFMGSYYLMDDPDDGFRAGWYKRYRPSPPVHYQTIYDIGRYPWNCIAWPRAFAKSTVFMILAMLLFLTRFQFHILLILSRGNMVTRRFQQMQYQLEYNRRIHEDFGRVKPKKGFGIWNTSFLTHAETRATITGMVVKGSLLGERPDLILTDDCEHDPEMQVSSTELIENFDRLMHNVILPMQEDGGTAVAVLGTLFNNRCWISRWLKMKAEDEPRVKYWNRQLYTAEDRNADGTLLWEAKFDQETLERDKERLGPSAYASQRLNRPGEAGAGVLPVHAELGQYSVENMDDQYYGDTPLSSKAELVSAKRQGEDIVEVRRPFSPAVGTMTRLLFMDYAQCNSATSDYVAMVVIGVENSTAYKDTWWVLDAHMDHIRGDALYAKLFRVGLKWRVHYLCIEAVAAQATVYNASDAYIGQRAEQMQWFPIVLPINYPSSMSKEERILQLEWRFHQNRIKYPAHLRFHSLGVRELYHQTVEFTGEKGCLTNDDVIDALAQAPFALKGRRPIAEDDSPVYGFDPVDLLTQGRREYNGLEVMAGVPLQQLTPDLINQIMAANQDPAPEVRQRKWMNLKHQQFRRSQQVIRTRSARR